MISRHLAITVALVAATLCTAAWSARRWSAARSDLERERAQLVATTAQARETIDLAARGERVGLAERPPQDVIAQVNRVLAEAGLPADRFQRLTAESDVAARPASGTPGPGGGGAPGAAYRVQSLRLVLQGMTPHDLGLFLSLWGASQPAWSPARLELARPQRRGAEPGRYDVTIVLSALYFAAATELP